MIRRRVPLLIWPLLVLPLVLPAELYRWVDEDGQVHYSDRLPPERSSDQRRVFTRGGETLRDVERQPTPEELEALERARRAAEEETLHRAEQERRQAEYDRMLLLSYGSEKDLEHSRERRLERIQVQLDSALQRRQRLEEEIHVLEREAAAAERGGADAETVYRRLETSRERLARENTRLEQRRRDIDAINREFDAKLERFRILRDQAGTD